MRIRFFLSATVFLLCSLPAALSAQRLEESRAYLGTAVRAVVCHPPDRAAGAGAAMALVWQMFADVHARMDLFDPSSDVSLLNARAGAGVKVHDDIYALLEKAREYTRLTRGVFDVSVGPLMALWKEAGQRNSFPTAVEIKAARESVGARRIELLGQGRVRLPPGMKIDLGGVAAGFAADEAARIFRAAGFNDFMVDAGGEIFAGGEACEGRPWRVGISDPEGRNRMKGVVALRDRAVSTSGSYRKYIEIQGERWPHIVNPVTGYPQRGVVSATVIAPDAVKADVLSTALCILGPGPGLRLVNGLGKGYAAMIMTEGEGGRLEAHATKSFSGYAVE